MVNSVLSCLCFDCHVTNMTKLTTSTPQSSRFRLAKIWKVASSSPIPPSLLSSLLLLLLQEDLSQRSLIDLSCKCVHFCPVLRLVLCCNVSRQFVGGWLQLCVGLLLIVTLARTLCSHCAAIVSGLCRSSTRLCFTPPHSVLPSPPASLLAL
jgi:hypothetical protein